LVWPSSGRGRRSLCHDEEAICRRNGWLAALVELVRMASGHVVRCAADGCQTWCRGESGRVARKCSAAIWMRTRDILSFSMIVARVGGRHGPARRSLAAFLRRLIPTVTAAGLLPDHPALRGRWAVLQRSQCSDDGAPLWSGRETVPGLPHSLAILVVRDRLYSAGDG
jgi:hypothetical protein